MRAIDELRPVEALYLLHTTGKERMDEENSLAATLVYLANEGYIEPIKSKFFQDIDLGLTDKGRSERSSLRPYEVDSLEAIASEDAEDLLDAVDGFDFRNYMTQRGFFRTEQRQRGIWIFKWNHTNYFPSEKYKQAIVELDGLKGQIASAITQKSQDKFLMNMSYAFPSTGLSNGFLEYAKEIADAAYATQAAINAAVIAAVVASTSSTTGTSN